MIWSNEEVAVFFVEASEKTQALGRVQEYVSADWQKSGRWICNTKHEFPRLFLPESASWFCCTWRLGKQWLWIDMISCCPLDKVFFTNGYGSKPWYYLVNTPKKRSKKLQITGGSCNPPKKEPIFGRFLMTSLPPAKARRAHPSRRHYWGVNSAGPKGQVATPKGRCPISGELRLDLDPLIVWWVEMSWICSFEVCSSYSWCLSNLVANKQRCVRQSPQLKQTKMIWSQLSDWTSTIQLYKKKMSHMSNILLKLCPNPKSTQLRGLLLHLLGSGKSTGARH